MLKDKIIILKTKQKNVYKASLTVNTQYYCSEKQDQEHIHKLLKNNILFNIYGNLIDPIHELLYITKSNSTNISEINNLEEKIFRTFRGE